MTAANGWPAFLGSKAGRLSEHASTNLNKDLPSTAKLGEATLTSQIPGPRGLTHAVWAVK